MCWVYVVCVMGVDVDQRCEWSRGKKGPVSGAAVPPASQVVLALVLISSSQFPSSLLALLPSVPIFTVDYTSSPLLLSPSPCPFFSPCFLLSRKKKAK